MFVSCFEIALALRSLVVFVVFVVLSLLVQNIRVSQSLPSVFNNGVCDRVGSSFLFSKSTVAFCHCGCVFALSLTMLRPARSNALSQFSFVINIDIEFELIEDHGESGRIRQSVTVLG